MDCASCYRIDWLVEAKHRPIVIVNTRGFYDPLRELLERSVRERFMHEKHLELWTFVDEPEQVLPAMAHSPDWPADALAIATLR